jgi:acetyltransferase-like isoleucine patch superfamily enzyme
MAVKEELGDNGASAGARFLEEVYRYSDRYRPSGDKRALGERLKNARALLRLELSEMHFAFVLANTLLWPMPRAVGRRLRPLVYRLIGFHIGRGTTISRPWQVQGMGKPYGRLTVGERCGIPGVRFELNAPVRIGNGVTIGEGTVVTTDKHEIDGPEHRFGRIRSSPITIGDGAWIQRNVMLIGVSVGAGAVVGSYAVVTKDVPPNTFVAGIPARIVRELPTESRDGSEEEALSE